MISDTPHVSVGVEVLVGPTSILAEVPSFTTALKEGATETHGTSEAVCFRFRAIGATCRDRGDGFAASESAVYLEFLGAVWPDVDDANSTLKPSVFALPTVLRGVVERLKDERRGA